jgi:hypothetical protein
LKVTLDRRADRRFGLEIDGDGHSVGGAGDVGLLAVGGLIAMVDASETPIGIVPVA